MGGIAAILARNWLETHSRASSAAESIGTIVVAAKPLGFGVAVASDNVTEIRWAAKALPEGAFMTKEDLFKDGRHIVLAPLARNEPVLRSKITGPGQRGSLSSLLQEGSSAVTVRVDDVRGVAGFILPGDFVDVVLIKTDDERARRENYSDILLQHVKVLAIDQLASERQEQPTVAKAVTLEVTPEQAQKILLASNVGKLSLILRKPGQAGSESSRRITERDLGAPRVSNELPAVLPAPPPLVKTREPTDTVTVGIVRGMKREDYAVRRGETSVGEGIIDESLVGAGVINESSVRAGVIKKDSQY